MEHRQERSRVSVKLCNRKNVAYSASVFKRVFDKLVSSANRIVKLENDVEPT